MQMDLPFVKKGILGFSIFFSCFSVGTLLADANEAYIIAASRDLGYVFDLTNGTSTSFSLPAQSSEIGLMYPELAYLSNGDGYLYSLDLNNYTYATVNPQISAGASIDSLALNDTVAYMTGSSNNTTYSIQLSNGSVGVVAVNGTIGNLHTTVANQMLGNSTLLYTEDSNGIIYQTNIATGESTQIAQLNTTYAPLAIVD
ncbi:MAG: hypothetical protein HY324_01640, partial [Chlamydiia bacterium]|nr:hypothetical protein [Chlamydiia bacterium]